MLNMFCFWKIRPVILSVVLDRPFLLLSFSTKNTEYFLIPLQNMVPALVVQLDVHPTGDQEFAGSTLTRLATFFHGDLIMKYFLLSFSPFR